MSVRRTGDVVFFFRRCPIAGNIIVTILSLLYVSIVIGCRRFCARSAVPPLDVRISGENRPLSADATYNISCQVIGARPPPRVIWLKDNQNLRNSKRSVSKMNDFSMYRVV